MPNKEYRVVCSKERFGSKIYVDIAPATGVIHDQIFFSRQQLHKLQSNTPLDKYNYSIMLSVDENDKMNILFPEPLGISENCELYKSMQRDYEMLEPLIIKAYTNMKQSGEDSTLRLYSVVEMNAIENAQYNQDWDNFEKRRRRRMQHIDKRISNLASSSFAHKHLHHQETQSLQEETMNNIISEQRAAANRRAASENKRAQSKLSAWQRFQKDYTGD